MNRFNGAVGREVLGYGTTTRTMHGMSILSDAVIFLKILERIMLHSTEEMLFSEK
jgi:hypothetical protein